MRTGPIPGADHVPPAEVVPLDTVAAVLAFAGEHRTALLVGAAVLMITLLALGLWLRRRKRDGWAGRLVDWAAVAVAVALSAEGMWEVAVHVLQLATYMAVLLFAFGELIMARAARRARVKVDRGERPGVYGVMVWSVALLVGTAAASAAPTVTEALIRFSAPALVAGQWWADLIDELRRKHPTRQQTSSWIWTPRRIGIELGWVRAGEDDLEVVDQRRRVRQIVAAASKERAGGRGKARARRRLDRIALTADAETVRAAQEQLRRAATIREVLYAGLDTPAKPAPSPMTDEERDLVEQTSKSFRALRTRVLAPLARPLLTVPVWRRPTTQPEPVRVDAPTHNGHTPAADEPAHVDDPDPEPVRVDETPAPVRRAVRKPAATKVDDALMEEQFARLTAELGGQRPSGSQLAAATGASKATANRWMAARRTRQPA